MSLADQDWPLTTEDMDNSRRRQDNSDPMYAFVHEHLLSILTPFADHVKDLESQVQVFRKDFLEQRLVLERCTAAQRRHEEHAQQLQGKVQEVSSKVTKSHKEVTEMIDVFSKVNVERQEKLRSSIDEELVALRSKVDPISVWSEDARKQLRELHEGLQVCSGKLSRCEQKDVELQETCELNKFCFHGLSERLEGTKAVADAASAEVHQLKAAECRHHQDLQDGLLRLTRRLDRTDTKVQNNHSDVMRTCDSLDSRIAASDKGLQAVTAAIASLDQNMKDTLLQYEESTEAEQSTSTNALERLANHVHRTREELLELSNRRHEELRDTLGTLDSTVGHQGRSLEKHGERLQELEGTSLHLDEGVRKAHQLCAELNQSVDSVWQKAQIADNEIRSLIVTTDTTGMDLEKMQTGLQQVTSHLHIAERDLQAAQAEVRALAEKLAAAEGELTNTVRRLDLAHDYWSGFSRGLQDTEQEVFEGKSGMLVKKAEARPRHLPSLPATLPRPHSICAGGREVGAGDAPARPSTSMT